MAGPGVCVLARKEETRQTVSAANVRGAVIAGSGLPKRPRSSRPTSATVNGGEDANGTGPAGGGLGAPPPPSTSLLTWVGLVVCLLLATPALVVDLGGPEVTDASEAEQLAISMHTTERFDRRAPNWLAPHFADEPRIERMPGMTWAHLAGMAQLSPDAPAGQLILVGRGISAFFALLAVASVFWVTHSIAGPRAALLGGLIMAANPLLIYFGRTGSEGMAYMSLYVVSIAAALWAIRPLKPAPSVERQFLGWVVCGVALGLAQLVAGPKALAMIGVPILVMLVICPGRLSHLLGLLAALLIGVLMVMPWAVYAYENLESPWEVWFRPFEATEAPGLGGFFGELGVLLGVGALALLPWVFWLIAAAMQPVSPSASGARTRLLLGWAWLASLVLVLVWIPGARGLSDLLPLLPAGVVLLVSVLSLHADLAEVGHNPVSWRALRWPYLALLVGLSLLVPLGLVFHGDLVAGGWLAGPWVADWHWAPGAGLAVVLLGLVGLTVPWVRAHRPGRVYFTWALWSLVLMTVLAVSVAQGPQAESSLRSLALTAVERMDGQTPLLWRGDAGAKRAGMSLYTRERITVVDEDQLKQAAVEHPRVLVLVAGDRTLEAFEARRLGLAEAADVALWEVSGVKGE